ncbi:MAG: hypothetical protein JXR86_18975 [Spirochaetales bacterium]|nr:hypothetical protein [Spirochaetales bacterium]
MKKFLGLLLILVLAGMSFMACDTGTSPIPTDDELTDDTTDDDPPPTVVPVDFPIVYTADFNSVSDLTEAYGSTAGTWGGDATGALTLEATAGAGGSQALQLDVVGNSDADGSGLFWAWTNNAIADDGFSADQADAQIPEATEAIVNVKANVSGIPAGGHVWLQFKPISASSGAPEYSAVDAAGLVTLEPIEIDADTVGFQDFTTTVPLGDILGDGVLYNAVVLSFEVSTDADSHTIILIDDLEVTYRSPVIYTVDFDSAADVTSAYGDTSGSWGGDAVGALTIEAMAGVGGTPAMQLEVTGNSDADGSGLFWAWTNNPVQDGGFIGDQADDQMLEDEVAEVTVQANVTGIPAGGHVWLQFKPVSATTGAPEYSAVDAAGLVTLAPIEIDADTVGFQEFTTTVPLGDILGDGVLYNGVVLSFEVSTDADSNTVVIVDDITVEYN